MPSDQLVERVVFASLGPPDQVHVVILIALHIQTMAGREVFAGASASLSRIADQIPLV